ncbi:Repeat domain-containing protein [Pustulibacterium marinum]|uniref:Repeat domain-containing protein n=1 Tax=Pustulibacterium marinum TaxID=1224947 RepID=A0A1I7EYV0_9FLAO|nr:VCBS repeat-containing protein [Pustulibacterium marinum]SFU29079.1 Repeat domain-containing protein [Pustulibacterium marinum]
MNKYSLYTILSVLLVACSQQEPRLFEELPSEKTNIDFVNHLTESDNLNILDYLYFYNGGGVAVGDINNDGLPDVYFTSNQESNKLYLNKGNNVFEDITEKAGVAGKSDWNTGVTMADVNADGFLDIYVCAVVGINGFDGYNELFINNGDGTFTEKAAEFGLDLDNYSSNAAFFDFDLDGDLDMYLLNHATHSEDSFGKADLRNRRSYESGDKLFRNDNGKFVDISETAGIYGGANGYGLGLAIADFNLDGYPDIYVGNDFHEDDYYYLNNGDGTFTESLKSFFGHTSRFSMGNDVADINHDGFPDIISLDMLPEDETVLKSSAGDDNVQMLKMRTEKLGYHYQYTRNMLHINQQGNYYTETALLSGVAATDWSWSALFSDYDQDGEQDLFISNGIAKRPNDLDYVKYISDDQIRNKLHTTKLVDNKALQLMPRGNVHNYIFKGGKDITFEDECGKWISKDTVISSGSALADFDNDGDVDIITNNLDHPATLYSNQINEKATFLKFTFEYTQKNKFGIGTKVIAYAKGQKQLKELFTTRGFQSSSQAMVHFGFGDVKTIDSVLVIWPNRTFQKLTNVATNQQLKITYKDGNSTFDYARLQPKNKKLFKVVEGNLGIDFVHKENNFVDFNRQKLIPYQISDRGPATAVGDIDNDGKDDIFFGNARGEAAAVYLQKDTAFVKQTFASLEKETTQEDVAAVIGNFSDNKNQLIVGSGGGEFYGNSDFLLDRVFEMQGDSLTKLAFPDIKENTSVIKTADIDNDGDLDLFVASNAVAMDFGAIPEANIVMNINGEFRVQKNDDIHRVGMVTDAVFTDIDGDGFQDLIVVGEWMQPTIFKNEKGVFKNVTTQYIQQNLNGLWQAIIPFDIDDDGDEDFILGNWGNNSKFKASANHPMRMYYADFDNNKYTETIVACEKDGEYYTLMGLDELSGQMVSLTRKKFTNYKDFAGKPIDQIFDEATLSKAKILEVHTLESGYLENKNGTFEFVPFDAKMQVAPITTFVKHDFTADGKMDVLAAGNYFGVTPYHSKYDGFSGAIIQQNKTTQLASDFGLNLSQKQVKQLNIIQLNHKNYLLVTINNQKAIVYEIQ